MGATYTAPEVSRPANALQTFRKSSRSFATLAAIRRAFGKDADIHCRNMGLNGYPA
jgi:hypothetical protein